MTVNALPADSPQSDKARGARALGAAHVAAWGFVFVILRIFAVSGYDWQTAFGVSTTLGLDDGLGLLFGSLMSGHLLTAGLLAIVLPLLIAAYLWGPRDHRPVVMLLATVMSPLPAPDAPVLVVVTVTLVPLFSAATKLAMLTTDDAVPEPGV